jgi:hypothetical protein
MAKAVSLDSSDLAPVKNPNPVSSTRQRGVVPSAEYVPLQFKLPPEFVQAFKKAALERGMKLNEFLISCFQEFMNSGK